MAFRFSLESVLRLRISYERQEQARLEMAAQHLYSAQEKFQSLGRERTGLDENFRVQMQAGVEAADLHFYLRSKSGLEVAEKEAAKAAAECRQKWADQRNKFLQARRDREVMASIRKRQEEAYVLDQNRREQQQVNDLFIMRRPLQNG